MLQKMHVVACVSLFSMMGQVFGSMYGSFSMVRLDTKQPKPQIHSFHDLVTMNKMDDNIFSNDEKLQSFGDINTRYEGYTPLQLLIDRPDATVKQVKILLDYGADLNIPALINLPQQGYVLWGSHKMGIDIGETPPHLYGNNKKFQEYCGNPEVVRYVFRKMFKEGFEKAICEVRGAR